MKHYTSTARRDARWWVVQCDQVPEALSQVARLDQAAEHQREAIAYVTDLNEDEIHVDVVPALDEAVDNKLTEINHERAALTQLKGALAADQAELAELLVKKYALSLRDAGTILGVSHQRIGQLITDAAPDIVSA